MPLYEYGCTCGELKAEYRNVDERREAPECKCGARMELVLSATPGVVKNPAVPKQRHRSK